MIKPQVIRINDLSDIDTSKISVFDLNNRYIDKNGNMYGVKYNPLSRKVEIIRIIRAVEKEANDMRQRIAKKKLFDFETPADIPAPQEQPRPAEVTEPFDFEPEVFINDCIKLMQTHRVRIKGIIMNIKNSNVFPKENKQATSELDGIFRNLEIDGELAFDHADNYQKEIQSYPRSITYYQAKIDNRGNQIIESLGGDRDRIMKFVYQYEMYATVSLVYKNLYAVLLDLRSLVDEKNTDEMKAMSHNDKQFFQDAKTSINNTINEIEGLKDKLSIMERHVTESSNY